MKHITPEKTAHHAELLGNRVRKQYRHLRKRFKRAGIDCFRLYDWDIPEVRAVVDWCAGHAVIAEYVRKQTGPEWLPAMAEAVRAALDLPADHVHVKQRRTKTEDELRYTRLAEDNKRFTVSERDLKFWVNLDDFLDTGLYSDHRDTRVLVRDLAAGQDFLNLFAYTGAFSCAAAAGEAASTGTVDRSQTNLDWARDNMQLNGFAGDAHRFEQADVDTFLSRAAKRGESWSLVFCDPPSFFKDVKAGKAFDINRDHIRLLRQVLKVTRPGGTVFFSTNHQRFEPRLTELSVDGLRELTPKTIPEDYRNRRIHRCWRMTARGSGRPNRG